METMKNS
jgi:hypothetical protein